MKKLISKIFIGAFLLLYSTSCTDTPVSEAETPLAESVKSVQEDYTIYEQNIEKYPPIFFPDSEINNKIPNVGNILALYSNFIKTNNPNSKERFIQKAKELQSQFIDKNDFKLASDKSNDLLTNQALSIAIMYQAYALTKEEIFLENGKKLIQALDVAQENGGFKNNWDGNIFFEENLEDKNHTLHEHLYALIALHYAQKISPDTEIENLLSAGINTLRVKLREYDAYFTSLYNKSKGDQQQYNFASAMGKDPDYFHELVILQLLTLYLQTQESILYEYAHLFLKQDMGRFSFLENNSKFEHIESSYSIDKKILGIKHLDDELWSWGKYWATSKIPSHLIVEFYNEVKNIEGISFFSIKENASPHHFKVYVKQQNDWKFVCDSDQITMRNQNYYLTNKYETFISTYFLPKTTYGSALKIEFTDSNSSNLIALREINILYDRKDEVETIINKLKRELGVK